MKKILFAFVLFTNAASAQLGNFNMELLANIDSRRIPAYLNFTDHYSSCWGYVAPDGREYAIMGCYMGTQIVDISDSNDIREVYFKMIDFDTSSLDYGNEWREMKTYSHYLYVISEAGSSHLEIFNLQYLPDSVVYIGKHIIPGRHNGHTISQSGHFLYLNGTLFNGSFQGTTVLDLSDPLNPVRRGGWNEHYVHDSRIINDTIYASNIDVGRLTIIDARNKDSLKTLAFFRTLPNPFTHNSDLTKDSRYIFTTDETETPPGRLKIWNKEDITNVLFVRNWMPTGINNTIVHNVEIFGDTAYVAHYEAGVRVINIIDPENPIEIGWYDTYPSSNSNTYRGNWGVYKFPSGKIIASDRQTGLYVLKLGNKVGIQSISSNAGSFFLAQNYPNPFNPATNIEFSIPKEEEIKLAVYDILGKEMQVLFSGKLNMGTYKFQWDASTLPSGVYFYKLSTTYSEIVKKMVFTK